jgi:DNA-directed RNA polymerase specialized sigma24 family protein
LRIESAFMSDVTHLLEAAKRGDHQAAADLLPLVYDELRKLAAAKMAAEAPGHTLDATTLVHEAYLRLVGAAAEAMQQVLVF